LTRLLLEMVSARLMARNRAAAACVMMDRLICFHKFGKGYEAEFVIYRHVHGKRQRRRILSQSPWVRQVRKKYSSTTIWQQRTKANRLGYNRHEDT
jgi:hypothetical protein